MQLCPSCSESRWYPSSVANWEKFFSRFIDSAAGSDHPASLRKNLAYNLQYLQYLDLTLSELPLSGVLKTQTWKSFILTGMGVTEAILYYLVRSKGLHKTVEWKAVREDKGNSFSLEGKTYRLQSELLEKLAAPEVGEMQLQTLIQKVESKKLLGPDHNIYSKLQFLRKLRNKVHLHTVDGYESTDWNSFNMAEYALMKGILFDLLSGPLFKPIAAQRSMLAFLDDSEQQDEE
jgi:hypothetical protein